MKGSRDLL